MAFDPAQTGGIGALVALATFLTRRLIRLDGTSIRIVDEQCAKELAVCRASILDLSIKVAMNAGVIATQAASILDLQTRLVALQKETP